jgi:hypothetical protein
MKNSRKSLSLIFAAGAAGVAFFQFASASFTAALPAETLVAIAASAAIVGVAVYDYSRRYQPLCPPDRVVRPALVARPACAATAPRHEECIAA